MHILVIPSWYPTVGSPVRGSFFHEQVHALKGAGEVVGVICSDMASLRALSWNKVSSYNKCQFVEDSGVPTYQCMQWNWLPYFHRLMAPLLVRNGLKLYKKYVKNHGEPDIIHAHCVFPAGLIALEIKRKFNVPYVVTEHSSAFGRGLLSDGQKKLAKECFDYANKRMVVSPKLGDVINNCLNVEVKDWEWSPNITSLYDSCSSQPKTVYSQGVFSFLNVAMMTPNKGQADLLKAFSMSYKGNHDVCLRIGGGGRIQKKLEELALRLGISEQVVFLGSLSRERVRDEMRVCDAFVLSSHYETFGVVLIEALSHGKPVVATMCGGPECIVNKNNGLLVPVKNIERLAEGMRELQRTYDKYDPIFISKECNEQFGEAAIVNQLLTVYHAALRER